MARYSFIREERYFCTLLMHVILNKPSVASKLFGIELNNEFEIYNESSILRDYWYKLGKPKRTTNERYITELNSKREEYLSTLCSVLGLDTSQLKDQPCYYSINNNGVKQYINSPSNYKDTEITYQPAIKLRALFNMRQDLLIISGNSLYFFEAKMESGNHKKQIHLFTLLRRLSDVKGKGWAGLPSFGDITQVNLFYIKKNYNPLNVEKSDSDAIEVVNWEKIFRIMREELKGRPGVYFDEILNNIGF
jgi:hypothetical protein